MPWICIIYLCIRMHSRCMELFEMVARPTAKKINYNFSQCTTHTVRDSRKSIPTAGKKTRARARETEMNCGRRNSYNLMDALMSNKKNCNAAANAIHLLVFALKSAVMALRVCMCSATLPTNARSMHLKLT